MWTSEYGMVLYFAAVYIEQSKSKFTLHQNEAGE